MDATIKHRSMPTWDAKCNDHLFYIGVNPDEQNKGEQYRVLNQAMKLWYTSAEASIPFNTWMETKLKEAHPDLYHHILDNEPHHDAYIVGKICDATSDNSAMEELYVQPDQRRHGYAKQLLQAMVTEADKHCTQLRLRAHPLATPTAYYWDSVWGKTSPRYEIRHSVSMSDAEHAQQLASLVTLYQRFDFHATNEQKGLWVNMIRPPHCQKKN